MNRSDPWRVRKRALVVAFVASLVGTLNGAVCVSDHYGPSKAFFFIFAVWNAWAVIDAVDDVVITTRVIHQARRLWLETRRRGHHVIRLTDQELATGIVPFHSDIWDMGSPGDDRFAWKADHPSGWTVSGRSGSIDEAQTEMERLFRQELEANGYEVTPSGIRVNRVHFDGPSPN